jgi:hypothetical protein
MLRGGVWILNWTMAALEDGRSYPLSSSSEAASAQKTLVRVKLTDSALRAIQDYHRNKVGSPPNRNFHT